MWICMYSDAAYQTLVSVESVDRPNVSRVGFKHIKVNKSHEFTKNCSYNQADIHDM